MKAHCNSCGGDREHINLCEHTESGSDEIDENYSIDWGKQSMILKCAGCGSTTFRIDTWNWECLTENGKPEVYTRYFPPPTFRQKPRWMRGKIFPKCPSDIEDLLNEAYIGMQNQCRRAVPMLIRAALERMMIDKVGDQGSFKKNLIEFENQGFLSQKQREVIEPVLEAGHATIHRGYVPTDKDLILLFDITETLIEVVYVHQEDAAALKARIPKRG